MMIGELFPYEEGITPTVQTCFSVYQLLDIIDQITLRKTDAILSWLSTIHVKPNTCLILGAYLTGAKIANVLAKRASVTVVDKHPCSKMLLDPGIGFELSLDTVSPCGWDVIIDTTGLGGIDIEDLLRFDPPDVFLVEDPCSDRSDTAILQCSQCYQLVSTIAASHKGVLFTGGLNTKTSGTMTLLMEILQRSMREATEQYGVLYSTTSMEHFERIFFKEENYTTFMKGLQKPALIISSLHPVRGDEIIHAHVSSVIAKITDFSVYIP